MLSLLFLFSCPAVSGSFGAPQRAPMDPWTVARQAPLSMEFSRKENWSELTCPPPGNVPHPGIKPVSPALAGGFFTAEPPGKPNDVFNTFNYPIIQSIRNKIYNVYLNI